MNEPNHDVTSIVELADTLVDAGDHTSAVALLSNVLSGHDPTTAAPDVDLALAATQFILYYDKFNSRRLHWARYAYTSNRHLYGPESDQACNAGSTLALAARYRQDHALAIAVSTEVLTIQERTGTLDDIVLARLNLAESLHGAGQCDTGLEQAERAWQQWTDEYGLHNRDGLDITFSLTAMLIACNHIERAAKISSQAKLAFPGAEGKAVQMALIEQAFRDLGHAKVCTSGLHSDDPNSHRGLLGATLEATLDKLMRRIFPSTDAEASPSSTVQAPPTTGPASANTSRATRRTSGPISAGEYLNPPYNGTRP